MARYWNVITHYWNVERRAVGRSVPRIKQLAIHWPHFGNIGHQSSKDLVPVVHLFTMVPGCLVTAVPSAALAILDHEMVLPIKGEVIDRAANANENICPKNLCSIACGDELRQMFSIRCYHGTANHRGLSGKNDVTVEGIICGRWMATESRVRPKLGSLSHRLRVERQIVQQIAEFIEPFNAAMSGLAFTDEMQQLPSKFVIADFWQIHPIVGVALQYCFNPIRNRLVAFAG